MPPIRTIKAPIRLLITRITALNMRRFTRPHSELALSVIPVEIDGLLPTSRQPTTMQRCYWMTGNAQVVNFCYLIAMDPDNPIVRLCVQGMEYESSDRVSEASRLFMSAWMQSTDDFERCIAAHYVARHQNPEEALIWNQKSLDCARTVGDERVSGFFPSLYLNMGKAYENLGNRDDARRFYVMALEVLSALSDDQYGRMTRTAVERALERIR